MIFVYPRRTLVALSLLCYMTFTSLAQLLVIVPPRVAMGETFQLVYRAPGVYDLSAFTAPQISPDLKVLYGPQLNVLQEMSQGVSKEYTIITYTLQASKLGRYQIGVAQLRSGAKRVTSTAQSIQVFQAQNAPLQPLASGESLHISDRDMYLRAVVSSQTVYLQQPVLVSLYLYSIYGKISGVDRKPPEVTDFVTKEIPIQHTSVVSESVGGRRGVKALIWQIIAYPQRSGELIIPAFEYEFQVSVDRQLERDEDLFANKAIATAHKKLRSQPLKLTVLPLPEGAPEGFDQLVGTFQMKGALSDSASTYETGRAMTYRLDIVGRGNVSLLLAPDLGLSDQFEVYEPQLVRDDQELQDGNTVVHRTYEYTIIPRSTGRHTIPVVRLPYFDPATKSYHTATTEAIAIEVSQGSNDVPQVGQATLAERLQRDAPYPYDTPAPVIGWHPWSRAGWAYWLLYPLLVIGGGIIFVIIGKRRCLLADRTAYHKSQSTSIAYQQLQAVHQSLNAGEIQQAMTQLYATIVQYLEWHYGHALTSMTREQLQSALELQGVADTEIDLWLTLLHEIELARYAPQQSTDSLPRWLDQVETLVDRPHSKL